MTTGGDKPKVGAETLVEPSKTEETKMGEEKHPETVPWTQHIGVKEMLKRAEEKVVSLEKQLTKGASAEQLQQVQAELDATKIARDVATKELEDIRTKSLSEKRGLLTKRGIPEDEIAEMSAKELDAVIRALEHYTPKPDLGGGGGGLTGELRPRDRIKAGFDVLHPSDK